ncbi:MAG: hypothetical protein HY664_06160 [Chloroflexi bacterium]|nr:hypothetical protein [Chloroflexota bacterium]
MTILSVPSRRNQRTWLDSLSPQGKPRRHSRDFPCQICGGHPGLPRGWGMRCTGFTLERATFCTREEYTGSLPLVISTNPPTYKHSLFGRCGCGVQHGWSTISDFSARPSTASQTTPQPALKLPLDTRHVIYSTALDLLPLRTEALQDLTARGLSHEAVIAAGYRSLPRRAGEHREFIRRLVDRFGEQTLRQCPGFTDKNGRLTFWTAFPDRDGYVVAYRREDGKITGIQAKVLGAKYLTARGTSLKEVYHVVGSPKPGEDLYATEGATKAIVASYLGGIAAFAVAGQSLAEEHIDAIKSLHPGRVIVALDQEENLNTDRARERWYRALSDAGLDVRVAVWEGQDVGGPKGLDDLIQEGSKPCLRRIYFVPAEIGQPRRPRASREAGPVEQGQSLEQVRALTRRSIEDFLVHHRRNRGKALLISTSPGSGKTRAVADALQNSSAARILVGTRRLATELSEQFGYTLISGRNQDNCQRIDVVDALSEAGHDVGKLACGTASKPRCPFRSSCTYCGQFRSAGTRVGAAEQLFNPKFLEGGNIVVVDDADLSRTLVERHHLSVEVLERSVEQLRGRRWLAARRLLSVVQHAIVDTPRQQSGRRGPAVMGPPLWDHLAKTARRYGEELQALIEALPRNRLLPQPQSNQAGVLAVEDVKAVPPAAVMRLMEALMEELPAFLSREDFNSRIRLDTRGIDICKLRELPNDTPGGFQFADIPVLLLDATPIDVFMNYLTRFHDRLPDVRASVRLPDNVTVVQYASSSNGHAVLREQWGVERVAAEIVAERRRFPALHPEQEAAICFVSQRDAIEKMGFKPSQVLTFGSARGSNALAEVKRLHVVGRPMPPGDDLVFLAQVLHRDEEAVSRQLVLRPQAYGGQRWEADVVDFADRRVSALLRAAREDEIVQVIHRARLVTLVPQASLDGVGNSRRQVRLVLHTSHPVPGLRVDELKLASHRIEVNEERRLEAEDRIIVAAERLRQRGEPVTITALARAAGAHKATVGKVLGTPVHTPKNINLYNRMNHVPQILNHADKAEDSEVVFEALMVWPKR